ncbi:unnamed protein product [Chondrus crispus]|uniref:Uncharacterized protein n=1 Tax=Chondrus crispus TaxID=2769 RepID=R7Q3U1_CHOCR|nr:unnamed protein product [Chondrus crispus]CDF32694.1 unnamed protein product [Chondrus crispus]|eukprot:XP_005712465.1 unnamed protein product [Chondrus crispus]
MKHDEPIPGWERQPYRIVDYLVVLMNFLCFMGKRRKLSNFRYANTARDWVASVQHFSKIQFWKVYGRVSARYNYHPQQRFHNAMRKFDASEHLAAQMAQTGNAAFYYNVCDRSGIAKTNYAVDLTKISDLNTIKASADYLFQEVRARNGVESANAAQGCFMRGFSRAIKVSDPSDWNSFRNEIRAYQRVNDDLIGKKEDDALLIALSYKGKDENINRRMRIIKPDGSPDEESGVLMQEKVQRESDFVDDFRWSQVVRSCIAMARTQGKSHVRIWIDRLVMMGVEKEEISRLYGLSPWEEFGLLPYALCPVIRVFSGGEVYYGTDFWRKLETVLGVAGRGLVVDDYMLRKYDRTIFYSPSVYERLADGVSCIGGKGLYVRSTTLALATAILTDGVSVRKSNEDLRTKAGAIAWKAWALRTIAEGAYSKAHPSMMAGQEAFTIGMESFQTIAFWESIVSRSKALVGQSYLDMSIQRSVEWRSSSQWDGVIEWTGMVGSSCWIQDREEIVEFLTRQSEIRLYVTPSGHVASTVELTSPVNSHKRTLVVDLSRFSTATDGYVTAVAEATGLWGKSVTPWYLRDRVDPDNDQKGEISEEELIFTYEAMKREHVGRIFLRWVIPPLIFLDVILYVPSYLRVYFASLAALTVLAIMCYYFVPSWPWVDKHDVGEALFDNLRLHCLFHSGIKTHFRLLKTVPYNQIKWN